MPQILKVNTEEKNGMYAAGRMRMKGWAQNLGTELAYNQKCDMELQGSRAAGQVQIPYSQERKRRRHIRETM